jgi:hypothetical protein
MKDLFSNDKEKITGVIKDIFDLHEKSMFLYDNHTLTRAYEKQVSCKSHSNQTRNERDL